MKKISQILFVSLVFVACVLVTTACHCPFASKQPKKLLVVTVTKSFRHSSIPTAEKILGELAAKSGAFTVDYCRQSEGDKEIKEKMSPENLKKYDGVIFANTTGDLPIDRDAFLQWIKSGKTFIGMHSATDTFSGHKPLDPYVEMIGGEFKTHGAQADVICINQDPKHPACRHFERTFALKDEIYLLNGFDRTKVHGLLTLDKHPNTGEAGDYPIAWCKKYGKGNVFYTSLGHREDVWESEAYQKHILGGIKWALGLEKGNVKPQVK